MASLEERCHEGEHPAQSEFRALHRRSLARPVFADLAAADLAAARQPSPREPHRLSRRALTMHRPWGRRDPEIMDEQRATTTLGLRQGFGGGEGTGERKVGVLARAVW